MFLPIIVTYIKVFSNPDLSTWSHGNSYIFYKVANSYKFVWPHSYEFVWFLRNHMYFTSPPIHMNLYKWPTPNPTPKPTRHWGLDKSYKIVRLRSFFNVNFQRLQNQYFDHWQLIHHIHHKITVTNISLHTSVGWYGHFSYRHIASLWDRRYTILLCMGGCGQERDSLYLS